MLQVPQSTMNRVQAVAGGGLAEVPAFDQGDAETTQRRFPRRADAVYPAADHDQIVRLGRQCRNIATHCRQATRRLNSESDASKVGIRSIPKVNDYDCACG